MDDDKAFIRQHAAEIAQALREQDEGGGGGGGKGPEDSTLELYRTLCFDEPLIESIPNFGTTASALSRQLVLSSSPLALSNRLVNGIVYLCRQRSTGNPSKDSTSQAITVDDSITAIALAKLAFAVLIQIPLECCQELHAQNIPRLRAFLGSYKGVIIAETRPEDFNNSQSMNVDSRINQLTEALAGMGTESTIPAPNTELEPTKDDSSLHEVWATESDPSDYDFGDGDATEFGQLPQTTELVDMLDPMVLSQADPQLTLEDGKAAIGSLLQLVNYSLFAPLFLQAKKQVEVHISQLTQLVLLLLQPPQLILTLTEDVSFSNTFQDAMLAPLWILRDAALHHPSQEHSFYTSSYMEVLQALLAVDQAYQSDDQQKNQTLPPQSVTSQSPLCSASIVGLSALSSWCCSAQITIPPTITAISDSMNDLAHVMERATANGYRDHLKHSIAPIMEVLTGITFQESKTLPLGGTTSTMIPQTLLNSGLLRQILMLSLEAKVDKDEEATVSIPYPLDHALWGLCIVYPTVVGKYVARYPGFSTIVRRYHPHAATKSKDCVQSILWNCFVREHCNKESDAPRIIWKNKAENGKSSLSIPSLMTKEECEEVGQKSWVTLCTMIESSIHDASLLPPQALEILQDWERLLKFLRIPRVGTSFQSIVANPQEQLTLIRNRLVQATGESEREAQASSDVPSLKEKLEDDEDEITGRKKPSLTTQQLVVATARKLLKQYTLFFQGNMRCSSKTD